MTQPKSKDRALDLGDLGATYTVVREIGRGGMGAVVLARHRPAGHEVAIKVASTDKLDAEALARFSREARLMARFRHPNIVRLYDVHQLGAGRVAIVMEYVRGTSLAAVLARGKRLSFESCRDILRDLGEALAHAHAKGVVHRDVKPHNVLIESSTGRAMLSDFGIAKAVTDDAEVTAVGSTMGTPAYMSPEQIDGLPVDNRSDIYGLGILGWEMLSGERAWAGEPLYRLLHKQKHEALPDLTIRRPNTPHSLLLAVEGALAKEPAHRWTSVEDMVQQLGSDDPTPALLARRARVATMRHAPSRAVSVDSATVPVARPERQPGPTGQPSAGNGDTLPDLQLRDEDSRSAQPAPQPEPAPPSAPAGRLALLLSRWRPRQSLLFTAGLGAGGLLMLLAVRLVVPAADAPEGRSAPAESPAGAGVLPRPDARDRARTQPVPAPAVPRDLAAPPAPVTAPAPPAVPPPVAAVLAPATGPARAAGATPGLPESRVATMALSLRARALVYADEPQRAMVVADSAIALDPRNGPAYLVRARARIAQREVRNAWTDIELGDRTGAHWEALALTTILRVRELGRAEVRDRLQPELRAALTPRRFLEADRAVALAIAVIQVGDHETALTLLELAAPLDPRLPALLVDPLLAPVRSTERFRVLRAKLAAGQDR